MKYLFSKLGVMTVIGHSISVEQYNRRKLQQTKFSPGSADDVIMDSLITGDVILFNRRWYEYHLLVAIMVKAYELYYGGMYDHCGVIIQNEKGVPLVYENTPFGGTKLRPFEDRILKSKAPSIVVFTLTRGLNLSTEQKTLHRELILAELENKGRLTSGEIFSFVDCFYRSLFNKDTISDTECATSLVDMNAKFILGTYTKLDIVPHMIENDHVDSSSNAVRRLTLKDLAERRVTFSSMLRTSAEDRTGAVVELKFSNDDVYIRMR